MKKVLLYVLLSSFIVGCAGSGNVDSADSQIKNKCFADAPNWVILGKGEGGFTAVGSAKIGKAGYQFARTAATANARDEMARSIDTKVKSLIQDFTEVTGIGDEETVDRVTLMTSKQVSSQTLQGTSPVATWESDCGDLYVLISADEDAIRKNLKSAVNSSYKNDNAEHQKVLAKNAQKELEDAILKEFPNE